MGNIIPFPGGERVLDDRAHAALEHYIYEARDIFTGSLFKYGPQALRLREAIPEKMEVLPPSVTLPFPDDAITGEGIVYDQDAKSFKIPSDEIKPEQKQHFLEKYTTISESETQKAGWFWTAAELFGFMAVRTVTEGKERQLAAVTSDSALEAWIHEVHMTEEDVPNVKINQALRNEYENRTAIIRAASAVMHFCLDTMEVSTEQGVRPLSTVANRAVTTYMGDNPLSVRSRLDFLAYTLPFGTQDLRVIFATELSV